MLMNQQKFHARSILRDRFSAEQIPDERHRKKYRKRVLRVNEHRGT
jgi:hypothetical protein